MDKIFSINKVKPSPIANIYSSDTTINMHYVMELSDLIYISTFNDNNVRYEYIYDLLCNKLESSIDKYNYCIFENNKCIAQRDNAKWPKNKYNGCCFDLGKKIDCGHLNCTKCNIQCISCRLFTCKYLKDRGIDYNIRKNIIIKTFMNIIQTPELVWNFFTPKEKILHNIRKYKIKI